MVRSVKQAIRRLPAAVLMGLLLLPAACPRAAAASTALTLVTVGDSVTEGIYFPVAGQWATAVYDSAYPRLLADRLTAEDGAAYTLVNAGISGTAVVDAEAVGAETGLSWLSRAVGTDRIRRCDMLTIMLGTGDAEDWAVHQPRFAADYRAIVEAYRACNPALRLYVLTPVFTPNTAYAALENGVLPALQELAAELDGTLIDVYAYTKVYVQNHTAADFFSEADRQTGLNLHPGENGHRVIADIVFAGITGTAVPDYITERPADLALTDSGMVDPSAAGSGARTGDAVSGDSTGTAAVGLPEPTVSSRVSPPESGETTAATGRTEASEATETTASAADGTETSADASASRLSADETAAVRAAGTGSALRRAGPYLAAAAVAAMAGTAVWFVRRRRRG